MIEQARVRFLAALRSCPSGEAPLPHLDWTVGELGAHVLQSVRAYRGLLRGAGPVSEGPDFMAARNAELIEAEGERSPKALAFAIDRELRRFADEVRTAAEGDFAWHGEIRLSPEALETTIASELVIHGWDLNRVARGRYQIDPQTALDLWDGLYPLAPSRVDRERAAGFSATYDLRLRNGGSYTFEFADGDLAVTPGSPKRADCRISADPVAYLLASYKRIPTWRTALDGSVVAYGRRPWLGLRMAALFQPM